MGSAWPFLYGYFSLKMVLMFFHDTRGSNRIGAGASGLISSGWGNQCLWDCGTTHEGSRWVSMWDRPPLEGQRERRDSFPDKAGESTFISRWGGAKGLRLRCAGKIGVPFEWGRVCRGTSGVSWRVWSTVSSFKTEHGISLKTLQWERVLSCIEGRIPWFSLRLGRKFGVSLELWRGPQGPALIASGKSSLISSRDGHLGIPRKSLQGK